LSYAVGLVEGNNVADNSTADMLSDILPVPAARVRDAVGVPRASEAVKKSPESLSPRRRRGAEVRKY